MIVDIKEVLETRIKSEYDSAYCEKCHHTGKLYYINVNKGISYDYCDCYLEIQYKKNYEKNLIKSRIPRNYWNPEISQYNNMGRNESEVAINERNLVVATSIYNDINSFLKPGKNLYLQGSVGAGKSFIACMVGKRSILKGFSVLFYEFTDLCNLFLKADKNDDDINAIDFSRYCDLLILDSIDKFKTSKDLQISLFNQTISTRIQNKRSNIFTSVTPFDLIKNVIGLGNHSLITERCKVISFVGKDYRESNS